MKSTELRRGNWVSDANGVQSQVETIAGKFILLNGSKEALSYDEVFGIPLAEDWFLRFRFTKHESGVSIYFITQFGEHSYLFEQMNNDKGHWWVNCAAMKLQYVHQFQNLIHALTGQELEMK